MLQRAKEIVRLGLELLAEEEAAASGEVPTVGSGRSVSFETGGGGTPAGSDGQIQFNDGGEFGASSAFTLSTADPAETVVGLTDQPNGTGLIEGIGDGVQLHIRAANGTDVGGEIVIISGSSAAGVGGDVTIESGSAGGDGDGGSINIKSGRSGNADGGDINIRASSDAPSGGNGGDVNVVAGSGSDGGNVLIQGGAPDGNIQMYSGDSNRFLELNNNGLILTDVVDASSLPTVDPAVAGQVWNDAGTLKVSAG